MDRLDRLLARLEETLDEEHLRGVEHHHLDAMAYRRVPRLPLTLVFPPDVELFPYVEAFEDPAKMLHNELLRTVGGASTWNSARLKDDFPPHVRSNHGIGIIASLFGAGWRIVNDAMPWIDHLEPPALRAAVAHGVPDLHRALGQRVLDTHAFYRATLARYPKCARCIRVTQPDLQGPFDIAHLLMGTDVFLAVVDDPSFVGELLSVVTETYIAFRRLLELDLTDAAGDGAVYLHGCLFGGKVLIKDDTAVVNLSGDMHREFSKAYNERILESFAGGSYHFCGPSRPWTRAAIGSPWLRGVNYGNPEMQDLAVEHAYWKARGVPVLLWGDALRLQCQEGDVLDQVRAAGITTGMTLAVRAADEREARVLLDRHRRAADAADRVPASLPAGARP